MTKHDRAPIRDERDLTERIRDGVSRGEHPAGAPDDNGKGDGPKRRPPWQNAVLVVAVCFAAFLVFSALRGGGEPVEAKKVPLTELLGAVDAGNARKAKIEDGSRTITLELADGAKISSGFPVGGGSDLTTKLVEQRVAVEVAPVSVPNPFVSMLVSFLPLLVILGVFLWLSTRFMGGMRGLGKRGEAVEVPETRFSDVAGVPEALADLTEVVDYLRDPARIDRIGGRAPRGVLLIGPPGTGKTLLARAVAGESQVPFLALSGSDFVETFVGVGARRVRDVFDKARKAERAIIFIDEIDAIGRKRSSGGGNPGSDERENTLNALLVELDGFSRSGIVVLAATNRSDMLDAALTRPGRFDRSVTVSAPDRSGRCELFKLYLSKLNLEPGVDADALARDFAARTPGMTGADIDNITNEAALVAARRNASTVTAADLDSALGRVVLGRERSGAAVSSRGRNITAWHEAGHALCALVSAELPNPSAVSIVPRGGAGGVTWVASGDEHFITRSYARDRLMMMLGGRAAEELLLDGDFTQGASSDLAGATGLATQMVCEWGMDTSLVHRDAERLFGDDAAEVHARVEAILEAAMDRARQVCARHREALDAIAGALLAEETLNADALIAVAETSGCEPGSWRVAGVVAPDGHTDSL